METRNKTPSSPRGEQSLACCTGTLVTGSKPAQGVGGRSRWKVSTNHTKGSQCEVEESLVYSCLKSLRTLEKPWQEDNGLLRCKPGFHYFCFLENIVI